VRDKAGDGARDAERDWARDVARESWREVVASEEDTEPQREPEMLLLVAPGGITWTLHRDSDAADNEDTAHRAQHTAHKNTGHSAQHTAYSTQHLRSRAASAKLSLNLRSM
jgi:hypothetical protein